jgi:hypothetical protein
MTCVLDGRTPSKRYAYVKVAGKMRGAHQIAYEQAYGTIPVGLLVRHRCDQPRRVNPDHLELGTNADNMRDRDERGRNFNANKTVCKRGHDLTDPANVREYPGQRQCRACDAWKKREQRARR